MMGSKLLRIDADRTAAAENAPPVGSDTRPYTSGHRNVQGTAFHPGTEAPIAAEHGPWHSDEVTVLRNGGTAGWGPRPNIAGRGDCPDNRCGYSPNQMVGENRFRRASWMPMTVLSRIRVRCLGEMNGAMVVGTMGIGFGGTPLGQRIEVLHLSEDGTELLAVQTMVLPVESGCVRSVVMGPDGSLYTAIDEGMIHKITLRSTHSAIAGCQIADVTGRARFGCLFDLASCCAGSKLRPTDTQTSANRWACVYPFRSGAKQQLQLPPSKRFVAAGVSIGSILKSVCQDGPHMRRSSVPADPVWRLLPQNTVFCLFS